MERASVASVSMDSSRIARPRNTFSTDEGCMYLSGLLMSRWVGSGHDEILAPGSK